MIKIEKYNVDTLSKSEIKKVNGGIVAPVVVAWSALAWLGNEVVQNWADIKRGAVDAWNEI